MADRRRRGQSGVLGPALRYMGPVRVVGTTQNGGPWVPPECTKCHARPPTWIQGPVSRCIACGTRWYQTRYTFEMPAKPTPKRPVWLHMPKPDAEVVA